MDLLNMLSGLFTDSSSVNALSAKTGTDSSQTKGILDVALPMLFGALKNNISSESGASSLLGALQQHTSTASLKDQIASADTEDGSKIIQHILGNNQSAVLQSISEKTGSDTSQVSNLLSSLAPGLMSSLSAVTSASGAQKAAAKKATITKTETAEKMKAVVKPVSTEKAKLSAKAVSTEKAKISAKPVPTEKVTAAAKPVPTETVKAAQEAAPAEEEPAAASSGLDLSSLLGIFGGNDASQESSGGGLGSLLGGLGGLGGLFGGSSDSSDDKSSDNPLMGILNSFLK